MKRARIGKCVSTTMMAAVLAMGSACPLRAEAAPPEFQETKAERDARMQWFRDAKFGMFIHWGLYSQLAGEWQDRTVTGGAEWIQKYLEIPASQYGGLVKTWNPTKYNARDWVRQMKDAGIKYICITTKHHDGFCLWPTKLNDDWNIARTLGGKDLLKPLADACHEEGLQFCIYHSILDWHHPDWPGRPGFNDTARGTPDKARYKTYLYGQLKELFNDYGPIGMVWFDGSWDGEIWTSDDGKALEDYTRSLQPSVILDNRSGYKPPQPDYGVEIKNAYSYIAAGDYISPEGEVPATGLPGIDWETCQTMQLPNNWGYNRLVGFRPFNDLLRQLIDVTSKGGNMLLNVGPDAEGELLPQAATCLEKFAVWMKLNSESIHGTTASPFEQLPFDGRCTRKPGVLYLHVFTWPENGRLIVPVRNKVRRARLLADPSGGGLAVRSTARGVEITVPEDAPDPIVSVVVVEIEGAPDVLPQPVDLAMGKPVKVSSVWAGRPELVKEFITDGNPGTMWASGETARSAWVEVDLLKDHAVSGAILNDAPYHRTQAFALEAKVGGQWKRLASGTSIGSRCELTFDSVNARFFRLALEKTSDTPTLAEFEILGMR